ncbi:MAG TPA: hypothetical protein VNS63_20730 [Blastocatellia bacterium]|nr:hypothetical protein [Blastocatellia bacterium]
MRILIKVLLVAVFCGVIGMQVSRYRQPASASGIEPQDVSYLDRRISMLENRLNSIESSLRTLEQQAMSQRSGASLPARDPETAIFRSELDILNARVRQLDCGLAQLDERTLSANAKEIRKRTNAQANDPCRLNPETPLQLSPRR